jgi:hypothetical protein
MGGRYQRSVYCPGYGGLSQYLGSSGGRGLADQFRWKLTLSGTYTSKSSYAAFFVWTIKFAPWLDLEELSSTPVQFLHFVGYQ